MNKKIKNLVTQYWRKQISRETLVSKFYRILKNQDSSLEDFFESVIKNQETNTIKSIITIGYALEHEQQFIDFVHMAILEPWHNSHEEMAHFLQNKKQSKSIKFLKKAIQQKHDYLELSGTGTRQFINQCGHALWSIGTNEAIAVVRELTKSDDPIVSDEMCYRLSRIENRNNYERNYELG